MNNSRPSLFNVPVRSGVLLAGVLACGAWTSEVEAAKPLQECLASYEQGQRLRIAGQLRKAREQLVLCSAEVCPADLRADCAKWLGEVEDAIPSVVLGGKTDTGADAVEVRVFVDGALVLERLDGKALPLDPGPHKLHFELEGYVPVDREILVREREKGRPVDILFVRPSTPPSSASRPSALPWILGGVGVVGLGVFTVFGLSGKEKQSDLDDSGCKPSCDPAEVDKIKSDYLVANVGLGVGLVSLSVAAVLLLTSPKAQAKQGLAPVVPTLRQNAGGVSGGFVWSF